MALDDRWKVGVSHRHAFPWIFEYALYLLSRYAWVWSSENWENGEPAGSGGSVWDHGVFFVDWEKT